MEGEAQEMEGEAQEIEGEAQEIEGEAQEGPLKICRHCSVASKTEAEDCPACGKPYRRQFNWKIWAAVAIIVVAFFVGFGVRKLLQGDDAGAGNTITLEQGEAAPLGDSRSEVVASLDGLEPVLEQEGEAQTLDGADQVLPPPDCIYYPITDDEENIWEFCFQEDVLVSSSSVGG